MAEIRTKKWSDPIEKEDGTRILVARYRPRALPKKDETWTEWHKELGPSVELHAEYFGKGGRRKLTWDELAQRYQEEMAAQHASIKELADRVRGGETITLLCHCAQASHCHRSLLKELMESAWRRPRR
jgi:uncharacterized protein YeaO (DUF488 family)